jgi:2-iminobutanoate/2-iminopropanoate deaminase
MTTTRTVIATKNAPGAIGPYSQAIRAGNLLFCSGQVALDPVTGELVAPDDVAAQTRRVLDNLGAVLEAGGASWDSVVRVTIFLIDMNDFATVNSIYGERFRAAPPARATVQVSALPRNARVEIDAIAMVE